MKFQKRFKNLKSNKKQLQKKLMMLKNNKETLNLMKLIKNWNLNTRKRKLKSQIQSLKLLKQIKK